MRLLAGSAERSPVRVFGFFLRLLLKAFQLLQPNFQSALTFSCMASCQVFIPRFRQLDHSLLLSLRVFHVSPLSLRTRFPVFGFLSSSVHPSVPPIVPIVCQVPMAHQQKQWEGDSGTIHGTRMVFIFLTAMQSQSSGVFPLVWRGRRKKEPEGREDKDSWREREREWESG